MFRIVSDGPNLFDACVWPGAPVLPAELANVDRLLSDRVLLEVFRPYFSPDSGRKSVPLETYLRLMYLKSSLDVGFERLVELVTGSVTFGLFCRIGMYDRVPHHSTLKKITQRCGPKAVEDLNRLLVAKADRLGKVDVSRARADTTLVDGNLAYPTDSGLLTKAVTKIVTAGTELSAKLGLGLSVHDVTGELRELNAAIGGASRSRRTTRKDEILVLTDQIADLAEDLARQAAPVAAGAVKALKGRARAPKGTRRALAALRTVLDAVGQFVHQARERARERPVAAADKRLSLHDGDARPVTKGTTRRGTQFGYTAQIVEDANGLIIAYSTHVGQPSDSDLIGPAIDEINALLGRAPTAVTADKTYGAAKACKALTKAGVELVAIVAKGKPGTERLAVEASTKFTGLTRWRAGSEARVSTMKRDHGWGRARMPGINGARTWLGWGVFSHNTRKLAKAI